MCPLWSVSYRTVTCHLVLWFRSHLSSSTLTGTKTKHFRYCCSSVKALSALKSNMWHLILLLLQMWFEKNIFMYMSISQLPWHPRHSSTNSQLIWDFGKLVFVYQSQFSNERRKQLPLCSRWISTEIYNPSWQELVVTLSCKPKICLQLVLFEQVEMILWLVSCLAAWIVSPGR